MFVWWKGVRFVLISRGCSKKTGSRLKPPHRIVTDPARTPVGRDDTALGLGVVCLRVGYSIYIGCLSLYSVFNS